MQDRKTQDQKCKGGNAGLENAGPGKWRTWDTLF